MAWSQSATDPRVDVNSGLLGSKRVVLGLEKNDKSERLIQETRENGLALLTFNNLRKNYKRFYSRTHHFIGTHLYNIASQASNMHSRATAKSVFTAIYQRQNGFYGRDGLRYLAISPPVRFKLLGLRISLSSMLTIWLNFGLSARSFCQQSSISWCRETGQSMGGGSL